MMPLPVLLASAILLGWPLLKLLATLLSRPKWKRIKELAADVRQDESYCPEERSLPDLQLAEAKGEPLQILMPILALTGGFAFAGVRLAGAPFGRSRMAETVAELEQEILELELQRANLELERPLSSKSPIWGDRRFQEMQELAFELALLRYPVASILTLLAIVIVAPFIAISEGLHASWRLVLRRLIVSSAHSSRAFARSVGVI
jgi:hypothetical protein